jgi:hypothetical protein
LLFEGVEKNLSINEADLENYNSLIQTNRDLISHGSRKKVVIPLSEIFPGKVVEKINVNRIVICIRDYEKEMDFSPSKNEFIDLVSKSLHHYPFTLKEKKRFRKFYSRVYKKIGRKNIRVLNSAYLNIAELSARLGDGA